MRSFSYIAQDARNKQTKGVINAEDEQEFLKKAKEKSDKLFSSALGSPLW